MEPILKLSQLGRDYIVRSQTLFGSKSKLIAVDHIDLELFPGETLGLVGESGCGKSTLGRMICRLEKPDRGEIYFKQEPMHKINGEDLRKKRKQFQPVFQDPLGSLNPRLSTKETLGEALVLNEKKINSGQLNELLNKVGLGSDVLNRYPHQLSGGQRQRIGIARALAMNPDLIVADEPVSSLDVSIQAQILNLFIDLQQLLGLSMVFISHDLRVVGHLADRVAVMYIGRIMEMAPAREIFENPRHPYTKALLAALPRLQPGRGRKRAVLKGDLPSPINPDPGCRFYSRCQYRQDDCLEYENNLLECNPGHQVACKYWKKK